MTHANPEPAPREANPRIHTTDLEASPRTYTPDSLRPAASPASHDGGDASGRHRIVSQLPPWPAPEPRIPARLRRRRLLIEYGGLVLALLCFAAAVCALARVFYLAEEQHLGLGMFALLAALVAGFSRLGCLVVLAIGRWLAWARALSSSPPSTGSDPSPRRRPRDSRC